MSNRQARREQSRRSRSDRSRSTATRRPTPGSSGGGSGPGDFLSGRFLLIAMAVVAVLIVGIGAFAAFSGDSNSDLAEQLRAAQAEFPEDLADGYAVGSEDAPLTITQYEDFRCPHCLNYTANNEPEIISEYVTDGQVRLVFQNFAVLGPESVSAAKAAECAQQQDRFWDMQHELFILQAEEGSSSGSFSDDTLRGIASDIGLDMEAYDTCFEENDTLTEVQDQTATARSFGLTGTPGFLFNGVPLSGGAPSNMDGWREVIDAELTRIAEEGDGAGGEGDDGEGDNGEGDDGEGTDGDATATATP